jgi:S-adenosylmethionine-dependent methyltransferase
VGPQRNSGKANREARSARVAAYYESGAAAEWARLDAHRTEYGVTLRTLVRHLSQPSRVLDAGGGPGRYAIELARRGHAVTLLDLSRACLDLAKLKATEAGVAFEAIVQANVLDLSELASNSYDAVLALGPLYHLTDGRDRLSALDELVRVSRPEGIVFVAFITRYAPFRNRVAEDPGWFAARRDLAREILETGVHSHSGLFTDAHFIRPSEAIAFLEQTGLRVIDVVGCEGVAVGREERINTLQGDAWEWWLTINETLGREPALYGASDHLLCVGQKL